MKKIFISLAICVSALSSFNAHAFDLKDLVGKAAEKVGSNGSGITDALGSLISSDKLTVADIVGNYTYSKPAVAFKSDNLLKKAGGTVVSSQIESKLAPYYKTVGIDKMTFVINNDNTFTMKVRGIPFSGTIEQCTDGSQANFTLKFKAVKKISVGSMNAYVVKSANKQVSITFDVSKLVSLLQKVGGLTGNSSIKTLTSLLSSYDGICAGFALTPQ